MIINHKKNPKKFFHPHLNEITRNLSNGLENNQINIHPIFKVLLKIEFENVIKEYLREMDKEELSKDVK